MALKLSVTDNRGVTCTYHRIPSAQVNWDDGDVLTVRVTVKSYVSAATRDLEKTTGTLTCVWQVDLDLPIKANTVNQNTLYAALKKLPNWAGSTDV